MNKERCLKNIFEIHLQNLAIAVSWKKEEASFIEAMPLPNFVYLQSKITKQLASNFLNTETLWNSCSKLT